MTVVAQEPLIRIVDDDEAFRNGIAFMLRCHGYRAEVYASAREFIVADAPSVPGCLILDIYMADMTGIELQELMNSRSMDLPIIFLTGHGEVEIAVKAMQDGAVNFLQKPVESRKLLEAVRLAIFEDAIRRGILPDLKLELRKFRRLTEREKEIAVLSSKGVSNHQIAERLDISIRTVETHRSTIRQKLEASSTKEMDDLVKRVVAELKL